MNDITLKERFWASMSHVPIITIVWICYLIYRYITNHLVILPSSIISINIKTLPIMPIIFTLFSIPISLTIMKLKKHSVFIRENAREAYYFNIWLLKFYFILAAISLIGLYMSNQVIVFCSWVLGLMASIFCLIQSLFGIVHTQCGKIYHYKYPIKYINR